MTRREWEGTDGEEEGTGRSREREEKGEKLLYVAGRWTEAAWLCPPPLASAPSPGRVSLTPP